VAVPKPMIIKQPLVYAVAGRDRELADFLSQWMELKRKSGAYRKRYDYWVLGQGAKKREPCWSRVVADNPLNNT
jgi:hypothetical protein